MKRWQWVQKFPGGAGWEEMKPDDKPGTGFVFLPDAEAEIDKARKEGEADGYFEGAKNVAFAYSEGPIAQKARAEERERIRLAVILMRTINYGPHSQGFNDAIDWIIENILSDHAPKPVDFNTPPLCPECHVGGGAHAFPCKVGKYIQEGDQNGPKPPKIEHLSMDETDRWTACVHSFNALVDAVNEMRK